jgi:hypothetical protein
LIRLAPRTSGLRPQLDSVMFPPHMRSISKEKERKSSDDDSNSDSAREDPSNQPILWGPIRMKFTMMIIMASMPLFTQCPNPRNCKVTVSLIKACLSIKNGAG